MLTRRSLIASAAGLGLGACMPKASLSDIAGAPAPEDASGPSLKKLGAERGIMVGGAFSGNTDPRYRRLVARHCGLITPEWQLKPRFLKPKKSSPLNFGPCDEIAEFATTNHLAFHGHTLFWHEEPIRWAESNDFEQVKKYYGGFIRDVVAHYPQAVSWDVFNEIVDESVKFRNEFLIRKFGLRFIDYCLRLAHELAPKAQLSINEYNFECAQDWCSTKQANMLSLVRDLQRKGSPIHAVGIQSHLSSVYRASTAATLEMIDRLADLGLDVYISELDVNDSTMPKDTVERDKLVADYYEEFLTAVLSRAAVKRVVFWGISDFDNWIVQRIAPEKRKNDAGPARPALFDANNQPKPAFYAVVRALKSAPAIDRLKLSSVKKD